MYPSPVASLFRPLLMGCVRGEGAMFKMVAVDHGGCFAYLLFFKASFLRKRKRQRKSFL